ncbi:hypothetical protein DICVIV_12942 [Dictyocaulus viviparus]|uniref:Uncharacterized protein n=1 Tax=Dictyocaulus viviparus TaxID=29172 RepID=A0A0D8X923_DICVI|nr:hypothetical protein DICVIV_12942 [Dictyocaulus viviparus]
MANAKTNRLGCAFEICDDQFNREYVLFVCKYGTDTNTVDHIYTITRFVEVQQEYKKHFFHQPLKAFNFVETEAVMETFNNQALLAQYIKILRCIERSLIAFILLDFYSAYPIGPLY